MHRSLRTISISAAAVALVAACGGDDEPEVNAEPAPAETTAAPTTTGAPPATDPPTTTEAVAATTEPPSTEPPATVDEGPRPMYPGVLEPDTYANKKFGAPLTFTIDEEWESMESATSLLLYRQSVAGSEVDPGELALILDDDGLGVDEVVEQLRTNPGITFGEPEPATVAGLDGVVVRSEGAAEDVDFLWIVDAEFGGNWYAAAGVQHEVYVVDNGGITMMIWIDAFPEIWEPFRAEAQTVLDSIAWGE